MQKGLAHQRLTDNQRGRTNWGQALALPFFCKGEDLFGLFYQSLSQEEGYQIANCNPLIQSSTPAAQKSQWATQILALQRDGDTYFLDLNQKDICTNIAKGRTDPGVESLAAKATAKTFATSY